MFDPRHPDLGPQIAVWLESADGTTFVDTLMVTNAVAVHGIGNRPGTWDMLSGPRFPYGRRPMALPIWAHARGKLYPTVAMNDGLDDQLTNHENELVARALLLPPHVDRRGRRRGHLRQRKVPQRQRAASARGSRRRTTRRAPTCSTSTAPCALPRIGYPGSCDPGDSAQYFAINDVDVVAAATPPYGAPFTGRWIVPAGVAPGDYRLAVEVAKEFDTNADHQHPNEVSAYDAQYYAGYGQSGNVGQPSVLYRVPIRLGPGAPATASTAAIAGYGDWTGATGQVWPPDATISDAPGSGAGRLLTFAGADGPARVQVAQGACPVVDCSGPNPPVPLPVSFTATPTPSGTSVAVTLRQSSESGGQPVIGYEVRYAAIGLQQPIDPASFPAWSAAGAVPVGAPGSETTVQVDGLTPLTDYAAGIRAIGVCGASPTTYQRFETPAIKFKQLSGCFVATAAFGSDLAPEVAALRKPATWRPPTARWPPLPSTSTTAPPPRPPPPSPNPKPREPSSATLSERCNANSPIRQPNSGRQAGPLAKPGREPARSLLA